MMKQHSIGELQANKGETSTNLRAKKEIKQATHLDDFVTDFAPKR